MFWDNVFKNMLALVTIWSAVAVLGVMVWAILGAAETAGRFLVRIPIPNVRWLRWPRLPNIAWERVSEPAKKVAMKILAVACVATFGVAAPLSLVLKFAQVGGVADPVAFVAAAILLSTFAVSMGGLYLLVKQRNVLREMGVYVLLWYVVAVSWCSAVVAGLPMALFSN